MLSKDPNYRRLKKLGGRGSFGSAYYWLGKDHLLLVEVSGYSEKYRRFFFRDIQAVLVEKNSRQLWQGLIAVAVGGVALLLVIAAAQEDWILAIVPFAGLAITIALMIYNLVAGKGATTSIRTAVQTFKLPGITRWKRGELLVSELTPLVTAAQPAGASAAAPVSVIFAAEAATPPAAGVSSVAAPEPSPES